mgnify:CR=1 FL=1
MLFNTATAEEPACKPAVKTCVKMTAAGQGSYRMIYTGRPAPDRIEPNAEDGTALYYFSCSQEQVYRYFLRFNVGEVSIMYPDSLKQRLHDYYREAMKAYE